MKIRLLQPGFENFSGQMGRLQFENGLSVADVEQRDLHRLSAVMQCELEDGSTASPTEALLAIADVGAPDAETAREQELQANAVALAAAGQSVESELKEVVSAHVAVYTEAELSAIADAEGIKGLRKVAEPLGIKGNSIKELIAAIVEAGAPKA